MARPPDEWDSPIVYCRAKGCGRVATHDLDYWPLCAWCAAVKREIARRWGPRE